MVEAPPKPIEPEINIEIEDLQALAKINPLAWEQLLHIVDNRQKNARIADLEAHLEHAHTQSLETQDKESKEMAISSNGLSHVS